MGKEFLKRDICICKMESLFCTLEIVTTLLTNYTSIENKKFKKIPLMFSNFPSGPEVKTLGFSSWVGKLRSYIPCGSAKKYFFKMLMFKSCSSA